MVRPRVLAVLRLMVSWNVGRLLAAVRSRDHHVSPSANLPPPPGGRGADLALPVMILERCHGPLTNARPWSRSGPSCRSRSRPTIESWK